jgi:hypothetical protein
MAQRRAEKALRKKRVLNKRIEMQTDNEVEALCRRIYIKTKDLYETIPDGPEKLGFQILYGPPFREAPIVFIGYQPGTGLKSPEEERKYGSEDGWPSVCEFATEEWVLAKKMRGMFRRELLEQCVGVNAIFVRSPSLEHYRKHVTLELRRKIEKFCLVQITEMVETLRPKVVVVIGFETLALFGKSKSILKSEKSQDVLVRTGSVAGREAIGTLHLSGARISTPDRAAIATHILAALT